MNDIVIGERIRSLTGRKTTAGTNLFAAANVAPPCSSVPSLEEAADEDSSIRNDCIRSGPACWGRA